LLCDEVMRDKDSGKRAYIGIFETIHVSRFPSLHRKLFVCFRLRGKGIQKIDIEIIGPKGREDGMVSKQGTIEFPSEETLYDEDVPFTELKIPHEGKYTVNLVNDGTSIASTSFYCKLREGIS